MTTSPDRTLAHSRSRAASTSFAPSVLLGVDLHHEPIDAALAHVPGKCASDRTGDEEIFVVTESHSHRGLGLEVPPNCVVQTTSPEESQSRTNASVEPPGKVWPGSVASPRAPDPAVEFAVAKRTVGLGAQATLPRAEIDYVPLLLCVQMLPFRRRSADARPGR